MPKGVFTISLDFELFWGVRDHRTLEGYGSNIAKVQEVVPALLSLFERYGVHCTWATVGFLFHENKEALMEKWPATLPDYLRKEYDPYPYIKDQLLEPVYHFAPHLIQQIRQSPGQEIGTHTYCHFYALEKDTTSEQFRADLVAAIEVAHEKGIPIHSIIFPRNQYGPVHISICEELGIKVFRGNEESSVYRPLSREEENSFRRAVRLADAYLNITGHHTHAWPKPAPIINVPASRFLRPWSSSLSFLDPLRFRRIRKSMWHAADQGHIYHLWWHPHNFGSHTEKNIEFLERILKEYSIAREKGQMESLNLSEIYERTNFTRN